MNHKELKTFAKTSTEILSILDHQLATISSDTSVNDTSTTPVHDQILFYKMSADTHRYLAELAPADHRARKSNRFPETKDVEADCALSAYKIASEMALEHLEACHPLRLMLAFNFSTFYADVRHSLRMANHVAKSAYESACEIVHVLSGTQYDDAIRVLQLIRDNISNWSLQLATGDAYEDDEESDVDVDEDWDGDDTFSEGDEDETNGITILGSPASSPSITRRGSHRGSRTNSISSDVGVNGMNANNNTNSGSNEDIGSGGEDGMVPSASAPVLKGHGGRALRPDSAQSDSRPDSAPRSRRPSISQSGSPRPGKKKRRRSLSSSSLKEGPVPHDHIESLLRGAENIPIGDISTQEGAGNLEQTLFEIFHSYLEGDVGTPVASLLQDGSTKTLENAILLAGKSTGLRLTTSALCRMLSDFHILPKMMNDLTVQSLVNIVALANTDGTKGTDRTIVLLYESKFNLSNQKRRKRPKLLDIKIKEPKGQNGKSGIRSTNNGRRPSSKNNNNKTLVPDIHNVDFYEFVDLLGRIAIISYKLNPGSIKDAPSQLNKPIDIISTFFRFQMHLYDVSTLKKESEWRTKIRRPWEAHERQKRLASPKAMMRSPLPGHPTRTMDRAASKGKLHHPSLNKDPRMREFKLTNSGSKELHNKIWTRSLKQIFDFYRKINTIIKKQKVISSSSGGDLFSDIVGMNNIITLSDFIKFLSDFKICPQILHKDLVKNIFETTTRKKKKEKNKNIKKDRPGSASTNKNKNSDTRPITAPQASSGSDWSLMGATWEDFLDLIGRCAIASDFLEPCKYVGDVEKIIGFFIMLELDEGGDWRKKMRSYGSPPRTSKMIRESTMGRSSGIPLVRIGAKGSPARGAGLRAVRAIE